jgi:endonuclease-3 related protein
MGAVLTQQTTWRSVEIAMRRLRAAGAVTSRGLRRLPRRRLEAMLRPTGYFRQKALRLRHVVHQLTIGYGSTLAGLLTTHPKQVRRVLLKTTGVGPETADCIELYAAGRSAIVVDGYASRIACRLGWIASPRAASALRARLATALPPDPVLLNEWHALLVELGKRICRQRPRCAICPLVTDCPTALRTAVATAGHIGRYN